MLVRDALKEDEVTGILLVCELRTLYNTQEMVLLVIYSIGYIVSIDDH